MPTETDNNAPLVTRLDPEIDRFDARSVALKFIEVWQTPQIRRAVAELLARSIRVAHEVAEGSWSVTLFTFGFRLNVGQVETLTCDYREARFLFQAPLQLDPGEEWETSAHDEAHFVSVPVPSGVCFIPIDRLPSLGKPVREAHESYIRSAASFKRGSPFRKSFSPGVLEYLEAVLEISLPRPSWFEARKAELVSLPEELDPSKTYREGAAYRVLVNAYERNPASRGACLDLHGSCCCICGFNFGAVYGPEMEGFIHVHHLRPIAEIGEEYELDPATDLLPVCPNCHAVIHRNRDRAKSAEEVREMIEKAKGR